VDRVLTKHGIKNAVHLREPSWENRFAEKWRLVAANIASHYKWSLSKVFHEKFPEAEAVIIIEDDLLFAPDFLEYMAVGKKALDADSTLMCASGWNDNGFDGLVREPMRLQRTSYFPGLGWLLTRKFYVGELEPKWNEATYGGWDHWLRDQQQSKGRDCVTPQVPRVFHNGIQGSFMTQELHDKYFGKIKLNDDPSPWLMDAYKGAVLETYKTRLIDLLNTEGPNKDIIQVVNKIDDLSDTAVRSFIDKGKEVLILWINANSNPNPDHIGAFFGLWHEIERGAHKGIHEIFWTGRQVNGKTDPIDPNAMRLLIVNKNPQTGILPEYLAQFKSEFNVFTDNHFV